MKAIVTTAGANPRLLLEASRGVEVRRFVAAASSG
jgi:hypothetical protein